MKDSESAYITYSTLVLFNNNTWSFKKWPNSAMWNLKARAHSHSIPTSVCTLHGLLCMHRDQAWLTGSDYLISAWWHHVNSPMVPPKLHLTIGLISQMCGCTEHWTHLEQLINLTYLTTSWSECIKLIILVFFPAKSWSTDSRPNLAKLWMNFPMFPSRLHSNTQSAAHTSPPAEAALVPISQFS